MQSKRELRVFLLAVSLALLASSVSQEPRFSGSEFSSTIPSSLEVGGIVFEEALDHCNVVISSVTLDGEGNEMFEALEMAGLIVVRVNTSNLQVGDYELNITVNGTFLQCPSSALQMSSTSTTSSMMSILATSTEPTASGGDTTPSLGSSQSEMASMGAEGTMTFSPSMSESGVSFFSEPTSSSGSVSVSIMDATPSSGSGRTSSFASSSSDGTLSVSIMDATPSSDSVSLPGQSGIPSSTASRTSSFASSSSDGTLSVSIMNATPSSDSVSLPGQSGIPSSTASRTSSFASSSSDGTLSVSIMDATPSVSSTSAPGPIPTPSPSPSPLQPMSFTTTLRLVVRVVLPVNLSVDNPTPFPTDTVTFNCSYWNSSDSNVSFVWMKDGMVVENETQSLFSLNVTFNDSRTMVFCTANGEISDTLTLNVQQPRLSIATDPAPSLNLTFQQRQLPALQLQMGDFVNGTCSFVGGPQFELFRGFSSVQLAADGELLQGQEIEQPVGNNVPVVIPVSSPGVAFCSVLVDGRNITSQMILFTIVPVIQNLTATPSTGISQGMPLNLTCEAAGGPTLNFTWTTPTGLRMGPVILIDNVTTDDAGDYVCEVTSEAGTTNRSITINVLNLSVDNPTPFPTDTVTFNCSFLGSSDSNVSFVWMKDGVVVENETQSLFSLNVTFNDSMTMVFCIADGITSDTLTLNVQQPRLSIATDPAPSLNLTFQQRQLPALQLQMGDFVNGTCSFVGGPQFELFGAFSSVQLAADGELLQGQEIERPVGNNVPVVIPVSSPGVLFCRVLVDGRNITSQMILFTVVPVIQNLTASPSTGVSQGMPLNLTCEAAGGPTLNFTWTTPTGPRVGPVILIDNVTADDAGDYVCEVTSEAGTTNRSITINVVNLSVDNPTPFPTDTVTFNCSFLGSSDSNVSFVWMKDGVVVENETQSLFSLNVTFNDSMTMVFCIADGITSDTLTLNVQQPRLSIATDPAPSLNLTFQQRQLPALQLQMGDFVNGTCSFVGGPQFELFGAFSSVQLAADGELLQGQEIERPVGNNVPVVIPVSSPGVLFCRVLVDGRNITSQMILFTVVPVIQNLTASPSTGVSQGMPLNLTCEAAGGPTLNFTWTTPTGPRVGPVILIDNVTADDAGDYVCEVTSEAGTTNRSITINVVNLSVDNPTPFPTDTVTFNCSFLGSSDSNVSFVWMKDGVVVENETQSLFSLNVTFNDSMTMVFCIADGIISDTLTLNVQQPRLSIATDPAPSLNLTFQQQQLPALQLQMGDDVNGTCSFVGGPQFELFGAFSFVQLAADGELLQGQEIDRPVGNGVPEVNMVFSPGVAFCRVVVDGRNITSQMILFTVVPVIQNLTATPSTGISLGMPLNLTCEAAGGPTLNFTWTTPTGLRMGPVILIDNVTADDAGDYVCEVTSEAGTTNRSITINVLNLSVDNPTPFPTDTVTFNCSFLGSSDSNVSFVWMKDGVVVENETQSLFSLNVTFNDNRTMVFCIADGITSDTLTLNVQQPRLSIMTDPAPSLNLTFQQLQLPALQLQMGDVVNGTCSFVGGPQFELFSAFSFVQLAADGELLQGQEIERLVGNNVPVVLPVSSPTVIFCRVLVDGQNITSQMILFTVVPVIQNLMATPSTGVSLGMPLNLTCEAAGGPTLNFTWTTPTGPRVGPVIIIDNVMADDAGDYTCEVTSEAGETNSSIAISVVNLSVDNPTPFPTDTVTFNCSYSSSSDSDVTYVWMKDGMVVENETQSLFSLDVTFNDNRTMVFCTADGFMSDTLTLNVRQPRLSIATDPAPSLNLTFQQQQLPALQLQMGDFVNGTCSFVGGPQFELFGAFSFVQLAADGELLQGQELDRPVGNGVPEVIPVFSPGVAFCRAVVDGRNITSQMILFTVVPVIQNLTATPSTGISQGMPLNLTCEAAGGPTLNFTWTTPTGPRVGPVILIDNVTADDAGDYTCEVMSEAGTTNSSIAIRVGVRVVVPPMSQSLNNSDTLLLTCVVSGSEPISYQWLKDGMLVEEGEGVSGINTSMLRIDPVSGFNFGGYQCIASNDVDQVLSEVAMVAVSPLGSVIVMPVRQTLFINQFVTLFCASLGGPNNTIQWSFSGVDLPGENGPILNVTRIDAADGGNYICTVSNIAGVDQATVMLFVNPILLVEPVDTNITLFEMGQLTCVARGFPSPEVSWYQNGTLLDVNALGNVDVSSTIMSRNTTSTLTFRNATFDNSGRYFCSATSSDPDVTGVNSSAVDVIVRDTPEQPVNVTVTEVRPFSVALSWVEPHDNNAPISDYIIDITAVGTGATRMVRANASVEAFNVTDLLPFVNYSFTVRAENDEGLGRPSTPVFQQTLEFFPSAPLNLKVDFIGRRSINVSWLIPAQPNGVLLFYQLEYSIEGTPPLLTLDVPAGTLTASLPDLTPAQVYLITVRANTSVGFGSRSEPVRATTVTDTPTQPLDLTVTNVTGSANSVIVSWAQPAEPNGVLLRYEVTVEGSILENGDVVDRGSISNVSNMTTTVNITNLASFSENNVSVRAFTSAGPGDAAMATFMTGEDTPFAPQNLTLEVDSSTSVNVTWTRPVIFRGQLLRYEVIFFNSSGDSGLRNITSPELAQQNVITFTVTGLTINTMYEISVRAVTGAGPGENVTDSIRTEEDAPPPVMMLKGQNVSDGILLEWIPPGLENGDYFYRLTVSFVSTFANEHPQRTEQGSFVHEFSRVNASNAPFSSFLLVNTSGDFQPQVVSDNVLHGPLSSSASYTFGLSGVNQLLNVSASLVFANVTTPVTRATPVTSLSVFPMSSGTNFALHVSWDLPSFPNGEIKSYDVEYVKTSGEGPATTTSVTGLSHVISDLPTFTFYNVTVRAFNDLIGFPFSVTERTNASVPVEPPTASGGGSASFQCLTIPLLIPSEDTGPLIRYDVIVYGPTTDGAPDEQRRRELAQQAIDGSGSNVRSVLTFNSTDAIKAASSPYEYCPVADNSQFFVFFRLEYKSDGSSPLITTSRVIVLNTQPIALPVVLVLLIVAIIAAAVIAVIVFFLVRRFREGGYRFDDEDTMTSNQQEMVESRVIFNTGAPQWEVPSAPIPINDFPEHVRHLHSDDDYRFSEEYKNVEPDHNPTIEAFSNPINAQKNRYGNITCYDHSRVRLTPTEGVPGDYINGNFLDGYKQPNGFIATQGPVPDSIVDFWRMVWEQDSPTIVMLTNLEERGRIKCHRYWPTDKTSTYGNITVSVQEELELSDYTVRTFSVIMSGCREERIVTQFHFTTWPDFGVPTHPTPLLLFIRRVKAMHPSGRGPIVVHCSAGVGRSGTFITLHTQMSRIIDEQQIDVFTFVRSMRSRRCLMVQTEAQYIFTHDALLEVLECGTTEVAARDLPNQYKLLQTEDEKTGKTFLELELQRLSKTLHAKKLQTEADKAPNKGKNRFGDILPFDESRCRLTSVIGVPNSDYINASFINGYVRKRAFIATQGPLPDTVADFWRMVWEYKCASIVMLTKEKEGSRVKCHRYWPDGSDMYGLLQVVLISENTYEGYIQREFKLIDTKDKSSLPVRQFQFTGWPEESGKTPNYGADLIDLIGQVQKWQRTSGDQPVVVHCSGGSGRTGTYIALANLLDRLKSEGVVDVFQTVRALRLQRPRMVQTLEQYRYCYTTVLEYLESFDLYANFK